MVTFGLFSVISSVCTVPILLPLEGLIWAVTTRVTDASRGNWLEFWANPSGSLPKFSLAALFPCQMIMYSVNQRTRIENGSSLTWKFLFFFLCDILYLHDRYSTRTVCGRYHQQCCGSAIIFFWDPDPDIVWNLKDPDAYERRLMKIVWYFAKFCTSAAYNIHHIL
jgi:hypothetical protein